MVIGATSNVHFVLICVSTIRTAPDKFSILVLYNFYFFVVSADLTVVRLGVQFCVHDIVINVLDYCEDSWNIVLQVCYFYIRDCRVKFQPEDSLEYS